MALDPEQIKSVNNRTAPSTPPTPTTSGQQAADNAMAHSGPTPSFAVTLTADADSSTVLHEFGHAFLTMMADWPRSPTRPSKPSRTCRSCSTGSASRTRRRGTR